MATAGNGNAMKDIDQEREPRESMDSGFGYLPDVEQGKSLLK